MYNTQQPTRPPTKNPAERAPSALRLRPSAPLRFSSKVRPFCLVTRRAKMPAVPPVPHKFSPFQPSLPLFASVPFSRLSCIARLQSFGHFHISGFDRPKTFGHFKDFDPAPRNLRPFPLFQRKILLPQPPTSSANSAFKKSGLPACRQANQKRNETGTKSK